jgi:hypothetical protein
MPASVDDVVSMRWNGRTGFFDVECRDGHREQATSDDVRNDRVCEAGGGTPGRETVVSFYHSDTCDSGLLATARFTDQPGENEARCQALESQVSSQVWGVRIGGGACSDTVDMTFAAACRLFQADGGRNVVQYFRSDTCASDMLASLRFTGRTDLDDRTCANAAPYVTHQVWGVRLDGQCADAQDTTFTAACALFRGKR